MGRFDALELAESKLGEVFARVAFKRWQLPPGTRVKRYVGQVGAVLEGSGDEDRQFVESMGVPLTSELGSGEREPVDLSLVPSGAGFHVKNPVVLTQIGPGGQVRFKSSGTAIGLAESSAEEPIETNGRLFYANALPDVDMAITPTPAGVSFSFSVRSVDAPEQAALEFDLPDGVRMRAADDTPELIELVRGPEVVGRIQPPAGWDDDGQPVAVGYELKGSRLLVNFRHQGEDLAYPLYIDPDYEDFGSYLGRAWDEWNNYQSAHGAWGWNLGSSPIRVWNVPSQTSGQYYNNGHWGALAWRNQRGYVRRVEGAHLAHTHWATCVRLGSLTSGWQAWKGYWDAPCNANVSGQFPAFNNGNTSYDDWIMMQLWFNGDGYRWGSANFEAYGIRAWLSDNENPTVTNVTNSAPTWVKAGDTVTVTPTAYDGGLGMYAFSLYAEAGVTTNWFHGCNGVRSGRRCPAYSVSGPMSFTIPSNYPEGGGRPISGNAIDVLGKGTSFYTAINVDRSAPTLQPVSGTLYDARNTTIRGSSHQLRVNASDALSGLNRVEIKVDGVVQWQGASGSSWTFNGASPAYDNPNTEPDNHSFEVTAIDNAGNRSSTQSFSLKWSNKPCP